MIFYICDDMLSALCQERAVRLTGGDSYGRVEVCSNGLWGTVCSDEFWDDHNARVLCSQLGFSQYGKIDTHYSSYYIILCVHAGEMGNMHNNYQ